MLSLAALAPALAARRAAAQESIARATRGMPSPKIKDISVITTQPSGVRLVVVKITTDQAGLYGYGCATFTQRADLVVPAVEKYLKPFLVGKPADRIEDTWQACYNSSYWRNGPVLNNAISGVDQALWDIKGRQAGMPVYQLLGGKVREACATYTSVSGNDTPQVIEGAKRAMAQGFRHVRLQVGVPAWPPTPPAAEPTRPKCRPCTTAPSSSPRPTFCARSKCCTNAARRWATRWSCCTTSTSASRRARPCSSPRTWRM